MARPFQVSDTTLLRYYQQGLRPGQIAKEVGLSRARVHIRLQNLGCALGRSLNQLPNPLSTGAHDDVLQEMVVAGRTGVQIALHFGCSECTVHRRLNALGYTLKEARLAWAQKQPPVQPLQVAPSNSVSRMFRFDNAARGRANA